MTILVVDDEALLVKGIRFNLKSDGYDVITGSNGQEAVELTKSENPDLVVLDVMMPVMDGNFPMCPSSCSPPRWTTWTSSWASTTGPTTT